MAGFSRTKLALAVSLAFSTVGCADTETNFASQDPQFEDPACRAIAIDRATDAGIIADDGDMQRQVFRLSYSNCMDWRRTH